MSTPSPTAEDVNVSNPLSSAQPSSSLPLTSGFSARKTPSSAPRVSTRIEGPHNRDEFAGSRSPSSFLSPPLSLPPHSAAPSTLPDRVLESGSQQSLPVTAQFRSHQPLATHAARPAPLSARAGSLPRLPVAIARTRGSRRGGRGGIGKRRSSSKPSRGANGGRGSGFSQAEVDSFLELLEEHQPLGRDEWDQVARLHEKRYPGQDRNVDSLRRKYGALCRKSAPTGDPTIPPDVLWAKKIREMMTERADLGDEGDLEEDGFEESQGVMDLTFNSGATMTNPGLQESAEVDDDAEDLCTDPDQSDQIRAAPSSSDQTGPSPRPLFRKREPWNRNGKKRDDDGELMTAFKLSLLQEQSRREEEHRLRMMDREDEKRRSAEDRRIMELRWAEERAMRQEEREQRDEERRRSNQMMKMVIMALVGKPQPTTTSSSPNRNE